jgi:hypothetical protein
MSTSDDNKDNKKKTGPLKEGDIAPFAWRSGTSDMASAGVTPFPIGTNLSLSASGLTGVRTKTFSDDSAKIPTISSADTFTNKTIDSASNTLSEIHQSPLVMRYGEATPVAAGTTGLLTLAYMGALSGHLYYSTNITFAAAYDTTWGLVNTQAVTNVSGQGTGILSPAVATGICRTLFAGRLRAIFKVSAVTSGNFYFGLTSNATMPLTVTPLATTDSGVFVGYRNTDSTYQTFNNDGTAQAEVVAPITGNLSTDGNWHTVEINWPNGGTPINAGIDGTFMPLTTRIPATTTPLFFNMVLATSTTAALTLSIKGAQVEFAK